MQERIIAWGIVALSVPVSSARGSEMAMLQGGSRIAGSFAASEGSAGVPENFLFEFAPPALVTRPDVRIVRSLVSARVDYIYEQVGIVGEFGFTRGFFELSVDLFSADLRDATYIVYSEYKAGDPGDKFDFTDSGQIGLSIWKTYSNRSFSNYEMPFSDVSFRYAGADSEGVYDYDGTFSYDIEVLYQIIYQVPLPVSSALFGMGAALCAGSHVLRRATRR